MSSSVFEVTKVTPHYWRATINQPPFNLAGPNFFIGLWNLLQEVEAESDLKILVFDSALPTSSSLIMIFNRLHQFRQIYWLNGH